MKWVQHFSSIHGNNEQFNIFHAWSITFCNQSNRNNKIYFRKNRNERYRPVLPLSSKLSLFLINVPSEEEANKTYLC